MASRSGRNPSGSPAASSRLASPRHRCRAALWLHTFGGNASSAGRASRKVSTLTLDESRGKGWASGVRVWRATRGLSQYAPDRRMRPFRLRARWCASPPASLGRRCRSRPRPPAARCPSAPSRSNAATTVPRAMPWSDASVPVKGSRAPAGNRPSRIAARTSSSRVYHPAEIRPALPRHVSFVEGQGRRNSACGQQQYSGTAVARLVIETLGV